MEGEGHRFKVGDKVRTTGGGFTALDSQDVYEGVIEEVIGYALYNVVIPGHGGPFLFSDEEILGLRDEQPSFMGYKVGDEVEVAVHDLKKTHYSTPIVYGPAKGIVTNVAVGALEVRWEASDGTPPWYLTYSPTTITDIQKKRKEATMKHDETKVNFYKVVRILNDGRKVSRYADSENYGPQLEYAEGVVTTAAVDTKGIYGYTTEEAAVDEKNTDNEPGQTQAEVWACEAAFEMGNAIGRAATANYGAVKLVRKVWPVEPKFEVGDQIRIRNDSSLSGMVATINRVSGDYLYIDIPFSISADEVEKCA